MRRPQQKKSVKQVNQAVRNFWHRKAFAALLSVHENRFLFYLTKTVNEILGKARRPAYVQFEQEKALIAPEEKLRRYYTIDETNVRLRNSANYYVGMPEINWVNFANLSVFSIFEKRKKRHFKKVESLKNKAKIGKCFLLHPAVLKNLNKHTIYLEDIEAEPSRATRDKSSALLVDLEKPDRDRALHALYDEEVHDIYSPRFSSDEDGDNDFEQLLMLDTGARPPIIKQRFTLSIKSRDLLDPEKGESVCSQIRETDGFSNDLMTEGFSELVETRNKQFSGAFDGVEDSWSSDESSDQNGSHTPERKTSRRCPAPILKPHKTIDCQNETKEAYLKKDEYTVVAQSPFRTAKPFFGMKSSHSRGQTSDRSSSGTGNIPKKVSGFTFWPKGPVRTVSGPDFKKIIVNLPSKERPSPKVPTIEEYQPSNPIPNAKATAGIDKGIEKLSMHPLTRVGSNKEFSDSKTGRLKNSFHHMQHSNATMPLKTTKNSLKDRKLMQSRPQLARLSVKQKETGCFLRNRTAKPLPTRPSKWVPEKPSTLRRDGELLKSKLAIGAASNPSKKSSTQKVSLQGNRWLQTDEYNYFTGEQNCTGNKTGRESTRQKSTKPSIFGKKTLRPSLSLLSKPSRNVLTEKTLKTGTSKDLLGKLRERFLGQIVKK